MDTDVLYKSIQFGLLLAGSAGIVVAFLRNLKDKSGENLRQATEAWEQVYKSTEAKYEALTKDLEAAHKKILELTDFVSKQEDIILQQRTQLAQLTVAQAREAEILRKTIREKEATITIQIAAINALKEVKEIKKDGTV
jgi:hypothetical protein